MRMFVQKHHKKIKVSFGVLLALMLVVGYFFVYPVWAMYQKAEVVKEHVKGIKQSIKDSKYPLLQQDTQTLKNDVEEIQNTFHRLGYLNWIPFINNYYKDSDNLLTAGKIMLASMDEILTDLEPYSSLLGFNAGEPNQDGQDLNRLIKVSPQLIPTADKILTDLEKVLPYIVSIDPSKYPNLGVYPVRDTLEQVVVNSRWLQNNMSEVRQVVEVLPQLLGATDPQRYLILFQNDKELRPTGGFITSYAVATVKEGEVKISDNRNIYEVSGEESYLPPPEPIVVYLKQQYWRMRDTNFSPDYKESMDTFNLYWYKLGLGAVDGIVSLDTQFVQSLLTQLGPIEVEENAVDFSGFYNLPDECLVGGDAFTPENVVCRLEAYAQKLSLNQYTRKAVIGELMEKMFKKIMSSPRDRWWPLFQSTMNQFAEKHILYYALDPKIQAIGDKFNLTGRIKEFDGDYLHVSDANLAGLKSDMYIKRTVEQKYEINDSNEIVKRVKVIYENTGAFDGWLNATGRNYVRLYVPEGSELIETKGGQVQTDTFEDLGKTVFDNFVLIPPLQQSTVEFVYKLPMKYKSGMQLLIQKQPGLDVVYHKIDIDGKLEEFEIQTDVTKQINP